MTDEGWFLLLNGDEVALMGLLLSLAAEGSLIYNHPDMVEGEGLTMKGRELAATIEARLPQ